MKIKKKTQNLIVLIITIATPIASVLFFFFNQHNQHLKEKFEIQKAELQIKIASIERNIGDSEYFDVREFFNVQKIKTNPISSSHYIPSGNFYADTTDNKWAYKQISPISFIRNALDVNPMEFQIGRKNSLILDSIMSNPKFKDYRKEYRFHEWKYNKSLILENDTETVTLNSTINVFVIKKDIAGLVFDQIKKGINGEKETLNQLNLDSTIVNQVIETTKKQYLVNSSGLLFSLFINGVIYNSLLSGDLIELQSVQQKSDVFYTKYSKEQNLLGNRVFETGEIFFAERNNHIYFVLIKSFDMQPIIQMEKATDINKWLYSLKFI